MNNKETLSAAQVGAAIYAAAGIRPEAPQGCGTLTEKLYGKGFVVEQPHRREWVTLSTWRGRRRIVVREGLSDPQLNWALGWGLAGLHVEREGIHLAANVTYNEIASWLVAPSEAFGAAYAEVGLDIAALAEEFVLTGAATALRVAELEGGPSCVVAIKNRKRVRRRGSLLRGFSDEAVRQLSRNRRPKSVRRIVLDDGIALFERPRDDS